VPWIYVFDRHLVLRFAHTRVQGFVIDKSIKLRARTRRTPGGPRLARLFETGTPEAKRNMPGGRPHPNKVVIFKTALSRRPSPDLRTRPSRAAERSTYWGDWISHRVHTVTMREPNPFLSTASPRLAETAPGLRTAQAARQRSLLTLCDND